MIDEKSSKKENYTPIICVHFGNQENLHLTLMQAKKYNPNSRIILIGDDSNENILDFVEHYHRNDLESDKIKELRDLYVHLSPNSEWYELACIERWFLINELCKKDPNIKNVLCIDSDILLFCDATKESLKFEKWDYTVSGFSGHTCYIKSPEVLENMTTFFLEVYKQSIPLALLKTHYFLNKTRGIREGISDMYLLCQYAQYIGINKGCFIEKKIDDSVYDFNFQWEYNTYKYNYIDSLMYRINIKTNEKTRINTLHFQGSTKRYMKKVYETGIVPKICPDDLMKRRKIVLKYEKILKSFIGRIVDKIPVKEMLNYGN